MKAGELIEKLQVELSAGATGLDNTVDNAYCGDLLSDVMAHAPQGSVWLTIQGHQNIVAVAVLKEIAAIILVNGRIPDDDTRTKADEEGIPVLLSQDTSYQVAGQLFKHGIGTDCG